MQATSSLQTVMPVISTTTLPSQALLLHVLSALLSPTVFNALTNLSVQTVRLDMQHLRAAAAKADIMTQIQMLMCLYVKLVLLIVVPAILTDAQLVI